MKKLLLFIVSCFFIAGVSLNAQTDHGYGCEHKTMSEKLYQNASQKMKDKMKKADEQLEKETQEFQRALLNKSLKATKKIIPVVFHVVHGNGTENISDAQIIDAVAQLNEDWNSTSATGVHSSFQHLIADIEVEFRLAKKNPTGGATTGIERHYNPGFTINGGQIAMKQQYGWPQHMYLNIYVVRSSDGGNGSAFAYYPSAVQSPWEHYDGIVASHWAVGRTGTAVSTHYKILAHEAGHWANLKHTWGDQTTWQSSAACNDDDGVSDTPNTSGNDGCNINASHCGSLDNVQNFMDYTTCSNMFTLGQKTRMQAALNSTVGRRNEIWQESNLIATGVISGGNDTQAPTVPTNLTAGTVTSTSVALSWTASTDNVGVTSYTVNNSTNNTNFTATTNSYTVTGLSPNTSYTFYVNAKDAAGNTSGWSSAVSVTTTDGGTGNYCNTSHSSPLNYFYISNVSFGSINKTSTLGNSSNAYSDYTSTSANLVKGSTYTLSESFTPGWNGNSGAAWIDWNGDGDFDDSEEKVLDVTSATSPYTASVTVPTSAATGATRMRVRLTYNGNLTPCGSVAYGETEDYTINISGSGGSDTQAPTVPTNFNVTGTTSSSISLSWTASTDNVGVTSYTINNATDNVNYTATGTSYTVTGLTANKSYTFYINAKDAAGNTSGWSSAAQGTTSGGTTNYCAAGASQGPEYISNVSFGSINNSSNRANYQDFTNISTNVNKGSSYTLTVSIGDIYSGDKVTTWFDWNSDGDFTDSGEKYSLTVSGSSATGGISVPSSASASSTRMRIRLHYYAAQGDMPCTTPSNSYGEVEDYTVNISGSAGKSLDAAVNFSAEIYPNPAMSKLSVRLKGATGANFQLISMNGQTVLEQKLTNKVTELDVSDIKRGMYFFKVTSLNQITTKKVILK